MRIDSFLLTAALLGGATTAVTAQAGSGRVLVQLRDEATGEPVPNATVRIAGVRQSGRTNDAGSWRSGRVPAGSRLVEVTRIGYARVRVAVEFPDSGEVERTVLMTASAVEMDPLEALGERRSNALEVRGFYARQRRGHGAFMTWERIEQLRPMRTVELFYHMRGFAVLRDRLGQPYLSTSRGSASMDPNCRAPLIYVDGTLVSGGPRFNSRGSGPLESINPESIAAIEGYAGVASVPDEYRTPDSVCGVVLLWTRSGDEG